MESTISLRQTTLGLPSAERAFLRYGMLLRVDWDLAVNVAPSMTFQAFIYWYTSVQ